jgi:hypothetical protein
LQIRMIAESALTGRPTVRPVVIYGIQECTHFIAPESAPACQASSKVCAEIVRPAAGS